jgi:AAA15 family ATPase/GTPase
MIIDFTIKNYRSFKEASSLSLIAEGLKNDGIAIRETNFKDNLLPVVGIFGQNAGGKSNIVKAFAYMQAAMLNADYINAPVNKHPLLQPFLLNRSSHNMPTHFEVSLWDEANHTQYNYGFEVGAPGVVSEWLEVTDRPEIKKRTRLIFERTGNTFTFDNTVKDDLEPIAKRVLDTALAINVFANLADPLSGKLLELISPKNIKTVEGTDTDQLMSYALDRFYTNEKLRSEVTRFIKNADIDINEVNVIRSAFNVDELPAGIPEELKALMNSSGQPNYNYRLTSKHSMYDDKGNKLDNTYEFNFGEQESLGTQKILALATILIDALDNGETIIFDELGSSLHPFLTKKIVELFQSSKFNKNAAQLIFTSHETFLLNKTSLESKFDLRRDQIWFADKGADESSSLKCLSEYKTKKEYELSKRYLEGRFGAVPVLKFDEGGINGGAE